MPAYFEADVKLGWRPTRVLELAVVGQNLVHAYHAEAIQPPIHEIPRSVYFSVRGRF